MSIGMHVDRAEALQEQGLPLTHRNLAYVEPRDNGNHAKPGRPTGGQVNPAHYRQHVVTNRRRGVGVDPKAVLQAERLAKLFPTAFNRAAIDAPEAMPLNIASSVGRVVVDEGVSYVVVWDGI